MIDASTLPSGTPIYSFVCNDGTNIHIATQPLRDWILKTKPQEVRVPIELRIAKKFLTENVVSLPRVTELIKRRAVDPIYFCRFQKLETGDLDVMLVDGHHRYTAAALSGAPFFPAHIIEFPDWQPFRVVNWIEFTQDELRNTPITPRNY